MKIIEQEMNKFLLTVLLFTFCVAGMSQQVKKVKIGEVEDYIKKSDHPILVSFWATWCAPCVEEIPWLQEGVENHKKDSVELILVSLDFPNYFPKKINDFIREKKFKATFLWLDETDANMFCPRIDAKWDGTIPVTLFVNNRIGYRKFMNRPMSDRQVEPEIKKMLNAQ
jgi:thiol-disulfide isomerase/thioredoxin